VGAGPPRRDISVEVLARRALMSPRTFARRFKATTARRRTPGCWPSGWRGRGAAGGSDAPSRRSPGWSASAPPRASASSSPARRGVSPRAYRQTFRRALAAADDDQAA
jgi:hypothetical protein